MLDTGSAVSLLRDSITKELGLELNHSSKIPPVQGIKGRKIRVLGQAKVTISSNSQPINISVTVVPDHYLDSAVLLDMNAIGQATLTLDHKARKVHWNNLAYPLVLATNEYGKVQRVTRETRPSPKNHQNYGRLTSRKHLDCYSTTMVEVKVDEQPGTVLVVEAKHPRVQSGIPMAMRVTKERTVFIPIINKTKLGLTLQPGTLLVTYEPVKNEELEVENSPSTISHNQESTRFRE